MANSQRPEGDAARVGLSRDRIVRAAVELTEREGADAPSMRALAAELGVAVMSLYNHVRDKADLLDGIAEYVIGGMKVADVPGAHWTERARALVRAYREVAHEFPRSVTIALTRRINAPAGLRPVEHALAIADDAGFDGETSVRVMRALLGYAMGAQMREVGAAAMLDHLLDDRARRLPELDSERFPHVVALRPALLRHDAETDFEFGLDLLITALDSLPRRS